MSWLHRWLHRGKADPLPFKLLFGRFRSLLENNTQVLELFADATEKQSGEYVFDRHYVTTTMSRAFDLTGKIVYDLNSIADGAYTSLYGVLDQLRAEAQGELSGEPVVARTDLCMPLADVDETHVNLVGGKSAHLGAIHSRLRIPMPPGFAITTYSYLRVLEHNRLDALVERVLNRTSPDHPEDCREIAERLLQAEIPPDVRRAVRRAMGPFLRRAAGSLFAVRSSALGEDEDLSFAGQYCTLLNVAPDDVLDAYRRVLASLYEPAAITYRRSTGSPLRGLMAVACMRMIHAECSGVLYTVDPNHPQAGTILLGVTPGLAGRALQGDQGMDTLVMARAAPHSVVEHRRSRDASARRVLPDADAAHLVEMALQIERYFKQPQDIEWAKDTDGRLYVIQTRRLKVVAPAELPQDLAALLRTKPVLMEHAGHVACRGVASGRVHAVRSHSDLDGFAPGSVLVARRASPRFIQVMPKASAIITDIGAPTGHMAALAREFRIPTLVDCGNATARLTHGSEITVDADDNKIYAGRVEELLDYQLVVESGFEDSPEYRLLRRLLRRITPLSLVDPESDTFRAEKCRSVHDVIRFAHEKAVEHLIELHGEQAAGKAGPARRLESELPIGLFVIDIGGGLSGTEALPSASGPIRPEVIRSAPMRALWNGLTTPGVWSHEPVDVGLRTFLHSAIAPPQRGRRSEHNLAVLSEDYANLSLNLGYHFNMVDAFLTDTREANHIYFRFVGGASDVEQRERRASMVAEILERLDFGVRRRSDLVVARVRKLPLAETQARLEAIGRLIGYTRQLDALMHDDGDVLRRAEAFLNGDFS